MPPTSNQPPRGVQGCRLLGTVVLRSCPSASLHGQVRARLGPGGYCRRSGNGGPQTCLPAAWLKGGPAQPIFIDTTPRPSRGAKPRGAEDTELPRARPHQAGSRGGGEIKAGYLTRCPWRKPWQPRGPGGRQAVQCPPFPLWCKGSKRRREHPAKASISVQQDQEQEDYKTEVIVEPKTASPPELFAGEDHFCQDSLY